MQERKLVKPLELAIIMIYPASLIPQRLLGFVNQSRGCPTLHYPTEPSLAAAISSGSRCETQAENATIREFFQQQGGGQGGSTDSLTRRIEALETIPDKQMLTQKYIMCSRAPVSLPPGRKTSGHFLTIRPPRPE